MTLSAWTSFAVTWLLLSLTPGPGVINTLSHSFSLGLVRALPNIIGQQVAVALMLVVAGAGLGVVLAGSPDALIVLQWCGVLYLIYLGVKIWRQAEESVALAAIDNELVSPSELFMRGLIANIANPKGILFYIAFLPQFFDTTKSLFLQYSLIVVTAVVINFSVMIFYGSLAAAIAACLKEPRVQVAINKTFGAVFVLIALWLLLD